MPFLGNAVFSNVARNLVRITGLSIDQADSGTIGLDGDAGADVELPDEFNPVNYRDIDLAEAIEVSFVAVEPINASGLLVRVDKAAGPPFRITMANDQPDAATPELEIWIRYH